MIRSIYALLLALFVTTPSSSQVPTKPGDYVIDQARVMSNTQFVQAHNLAQRLNETTKVELAVVTLTSLNGREPVDVATEIGRNLGVGKQAEVGSEDRNNGLVLLIVPRQGEVKGKCFLAVGNGMEGRITDLLATKVCTETIVPTIKNHGMDYGAGILAGIERIQQLATTTQAKAAQDPTSTATTSTRTGLWWVLGAGILVILIGVIAKIFANDSEPPLPRTTDYDSGRLATGALLGAAAVATTTKRKKDHEDYSPSTFIPSHHSSDDDSNSSSSSSFGSSSGGGGSGGSDFGGFGGGGGFSGGGGGGDI